MLTCKQVGKALAENNYHDLPPLSRWGLKIHVFLCCMCGKYNRQVMDIQDGVHEFLEHETLNDLPPIPQKLPADARQRIRESLAQL